MSSLIETSEVPEKIAKRKIIVYRSSLDPIVMKLIAEKKKNELFGKHFSESKPEEIKVISVDKYYEPYFLVSAKYNVDYSKKRVYVHDVEKETKVVKVLGNVCEPETRVGPDGESSRLIKLEVEECFSYEDKAFFVFDKRGHEIPPEQVPAAPSEKHPHKILKKFGEKVVEIEIPSKKIMDLVKARIVKRPSDADEIQNELFQISERIVYSPKYRMMFHNLRTNKEKALTIDGVTARQSA